MRVGNNKWDVYRIGISSLKALKYMINDLLLVDLWLVFAFMSLL